MQLEHLAFLLKQRDISAFEFLYDFTALSVYKLILTVEPNRRVADYILEQAFIEVWNSIEEYQESLSFSAWLCRKAKLVAERFVAHKSS